MLAYIDPGSGSLLLSMILGGVAGIATFFRTGLRRLRSKRKASAGDAAGTTEHDR